jgi:UDP-N-acetylmuramoylalanine--D-glutamate ligase
MKKVTVVLGLGLSGVAVAEFLLKKGHAVVGIDSKESEDVQRLKNLGLAVQDETTLIDWSQVEQLVVSPGISPTHPLYSAARFRNIEVVGEAEVALCHFPGRLVAVTGTNGKTTVTLLVEHVLNTSGVKAKALGNVGTALCHYLTHPGMEEAFVVELSSYQLETMTTPVFEAAALLNITPDHLDRYADMQEYAKAKCRLQHVLKKGAPLYVGPQVVHEFSHLLTANNAVSISNVEPLNLPYPGTHDRENATAAWALCRHFSITREQFCAAYKTFQKPRHRIEFVEEIDGVSFYDDSKGTNIDAVIKAVDTMKGSVILIAGGVDKGASYLPWKEHFLGKVKQIIAMGEAAKKIAQELNPYFNVTLADSLSSAVTTAATAASRGDVVLLSPGCSSFDMFRDYVHRGEEFQRYVRSICFKKE